MTPLVWWQRFGNKELPLNTAISCQPETESLGPSARGGLRRRVIINEVSCSDPSCYPEEGSLLICQLEASQHSCSVGFVKLDTRPQQLNSFHNQELRKKVCSFVSSRHFSKAVLWALLSSISDPGSPAWGSGST